MKFSFFKIFACIPFVLFICSCSKEGTTDATQSGTTSTGQVGSLSRFAIVGNYLYAVTYNHLVTYDISNPSNPVQTNNADLSTLEVETIYPFNNHLFIGTRVGLFIYSIDNPASPVKQGEAAHLRSCDPVVANDSMAFVTLSKHAWCGPTAVSGLYVYDVRNIFQPQQVKVVPIENPEGLGLKGNILYVCGNDEGLKVYNVANPVNPVEIRTITGQYFKDVIPYGDLLICYINNGIMLYDISDPTNPVAVKLIANS